jgi:hypothetical protein
LEETERQGKVFTKLMKASGKIALLLCLQLSLFSLYLERDVVADPVISMAFNQANALNSQLFQSQWGQRVSENGEQIGPVNEEASSGKNPKSLMIVPNTQNHWDVTVEGNGIFAQMPGDSSHSQSAGGGITTEFSYHWNRSVTTGLYVGYQGSQLTKTTSFSPTESVTIFFPIHAVYNYVLPTTKDASTQTDNAPRFGLFGSYGQADGKGFYGLGLIGGTYHQSTFRDQYKLGVFSTPFFVDPGSTTFISANIGAPELDSMMAGEYDFKVKGFTFGPTTSLQYTYYYQNDQNILISRFINGQSPQSFLLKAANFNTSSLLYSLGGHLAYTWNAGKDLVIVPQINMSWQHQFLQTIYNQNDSSYQFPDAILAGVGVTANYRQRYNASFFYNCYAGNQDTYAVGTQYFISQNIFLSLGMTF